MSNFRLYTLAVLCLFISSITLTSCKKDRGANPEVLTPGPDLNFYALTNDNKILALNAKNPSNVLATVTITGLQTGENIMGIDFRPATGQLYGIGSTSRIYVIDYKTGIARPIGAASFATPISGSNFGFDFNPTVDRIRLVSSNGQNLRLNPETGAVMIIDGPINGVANAKVSSVAYTSNRAGAASTILFDIDATTDKLYKQDPPNDGKLVEVGSLGFDVDEVGGFDINPDGSVALAALQVGGRSSLFTVELATGKASKIADLGSQITGIAIPTEPVAYAVSATNELLIFNPASATPTFVTKAITGIQAGESILGIDMRPANGQLYALGSTSRIYTINASSGAAAMVGTGPLTTLIPATAVGFDFNPVPDRIRIVGNNGQNFRINPVDGVLAIDLPISLAGASITGAAYTNNFAGATATVLYDIDSTTDRLYKQDPPNNGTLVDVGPLGINVEAANGFDIGGTSGIAYGIFTVGTAQRLYSVNLTTGATTAISTIATPVRGFTLGLGF
jgi:hypothetical protein